VNRDDLTISIKKLAGETGFDDCRVAAAGEAAHAGLFRHWLAAGCHGDMHWLTRAPERRCDPREVLPGCRSVVCVALNYFTGPASGPRPGTDARGPGNHRIARYALNDDYHGIIAAMLRALDGALRQHGGVQRCCVDHGPVLERDFASTAGLGWTGKSTVQIHRRLGTWFFLAEVLTTLELTPDPPAADHCGTCTRCIAACPTGAITAPRRLDARRCISYLTIEHRGPIPEEFRRALGDRIYGCDDCLAACPWNRFARASHDLRFHPRPAIFRHSLRDFLALDEPAFRALFADSPVLRLKLPRFLRNVCVALGNTGTAADLPALARTAAHPDPLVAEPAHWAAREIRRRTTCGDRAT
jgi:epoxyqueuosine reductase